MTAAHVPPASASGPGSRSATPGARFFAAVARSVAFVTAGNVLVATSFALQRAGSHWGATFVFGETIGIVVLLLVVGGRHALLRARAFTLGRFFAWAVASTLVGTGGGVVLAARLLGMPLEQVAGWRELAVTGWIAFLFTACATAFGLARAHLSALREQSAANALRREAAEAAAMRARLQALQAQIEPHFLFNTLAALDSLIASDPPRARQLLGSLNRLLRGSLHASRADAETLAEQFRLLEALLEIYAVRFGSRLAFGLDLPDDCRDARVPPMLLQPLVENAVRHGIEGRLEGGRVDVRASRTATQLLLSVRDTGAGFGAQPASPGTGVGLSNVRERLRALYGTRAELAIGENVPHGVAVRIALPVDAVLDSEQGAPDRGSHGERQAFGSGQARSGGADGAASFDAGIATGKDGDGGASAQRHVSRIDAIGGCA